MILVDDDFDASGIKESFGGEPGCLPRKFDEGETHYIDADGKQIFCAPPLSLDAIPLVPESQWKDRIKAMAGRFARQKYDAAAKQPNNQGQRNYCWAASLAEVLETLRSIEGQPFIELAWESLGGDVSYRNVGNSLDSALAYASQHGMCARSYVPTVGSLSPSQWKTGWQTDALNHVPTEWWDLGTQDIWAKTVSVLLAGLPIYVGFDWASHAMMLDELQINTKGQICVHTPNTWGGTGENAWILTGQKAIPSLGSFAPRSITLSQI